MADNVSITAGSGTTLAADDVGGGVLVPRAKMTWGPDGTANDTDVATGKPFPVQVRSATGLIPIGEPTDAKSTATDGTSTTGISIWKQISASVQGLNTAIGSTLWDLSTGTGGSRTQRVAIDTAQIPVLGQATKSASTPVTIASDQALGYATTVTALAARHTGTTTTYTAGDIWSDSESAPTAGGYTLTNAARISGGSGILSDLFLFSDGNAPSPLMQGELYIFDSAATVVNDNSALTLSDADAVKLVAVVPFTLASIVGAGTVTGSYVHLQGLNIGFTCVGTANLRFFIHIKNAYVPVSAEVLTVRAKIVQTN